MGLDEIIKAFAESSLDQIWAKAHIIDFGHELAGLRKDDLGNIIKKDAYGDRSSPYGWEKDHVYPSSLGGSDRLPNIRPLHWRANILKSNTGPFGMGGSFR